MTELPLPEEAIFLQALEIEATAERAAFLDRACAADARLRAVVDALLRASAKSGDLLDISERPDASPTLGQSSAERAGTQIGPYQLLQQIGEGGMGTVFMAEQTEPVQRRVAVKVIKPGMDSRQVIARFAAEKQALALMDHVNIARVLDAGVTGGEPGGVSPGRPYFVMELVHGVPITKYCDDNHLTPRQRLELFVPVCQAIQHAHQKGIIHRDIKPSNVMVTLYDGKPVPKVIDFGVAKATEQKLSEQTLFTQYGTMVGTLEYMSPEQAETSALGVDTRSDIYSLGVLLYELLTGSTPLSGKQMKEAAYSEILRLIREEEPPRPSTRLSDSGEALASISAQRHMEPAKLSKLMRGDLDWIVMKTLEKDRNRRYETANGLAMDVQRYLTDEPVLACPPSAAYRFRKFARRNKSALAVAALILFFISLLGSGAGWAVRDRTAQEATVNQQREAREVEVVRERQEREAEVGRERTTRQTLTKERVLLALDEAVKRHQEGRWREALDAAKKAEALAATGGSDTEMQQRVAEILGDMQMLANLEDVRTDSTKNQSGFDLKQQDEGNARAFREYGIDVDALDREVAANRIRARSIPYELAVFLDSWSHVRRRLASQGSKPIGKDWKELLELARVADPDPWRDQFRAAVLNDDRQALVEVAASAPISSLPADTVDRLGDALLGKGAIKEAAAFLKTGQRLHPQDYWINVNLGNSLVRLGPEQLDDAIRYYTAAVALRPEAALSHINLGDALASQEKLDEAVVCFRKAIELCPKRTQYHNRLAAALARQNKPGEAALAFREATRLKADETAAASRRKADEAAAPFREAVRLQPDYHLAHYNLGRVLGKQGNLDDAIAAYQEALRLKPDLLAKEIVGSLAFDFVACPEPMACDPQRAVELIEQVLAHKPDAVMLASLVASSAPMLLLADDAVTYRRLCARVIGELGDTTEPRTAYLVARTCALAPDAASDPARLVQMADRAAQAERMPHYLHTLGLAYYRAGQFDEAIEQLHLSSEGNWNANAANWLVLAMAHERLGHVEEARKWLDKAVQWIDSPLLKPANNSVDALRSLHRHDSLACRVLRREAETLLALQPLAAPEGQETAGEKK